MKDKNDKASQIKTFYKTTADYIQDQRKDLGDIKMTFEQLSALSAGWSAFSTVTSEKSEISDNTPESDSIYKNKNKNKNKF